MALSGMPANDADAGSCAITIPDSPLIVFEPTVPSDPVPERMTPMARSR